MRDTRTSGNDPLLKWLLGFFGAIAGIMLLPKTIKYMLRRFLFGLVGEVVAVVLTGLLTEKLVGWVAHSENHREQPAVRERPERPQTDPHRP